MWSFRKFEDIKSNFTKYDVKEFLDNCIVNDPMYVYEFTQQLVYFAIRHQENDEFDDAKKELDTILKYGDLVNDKLGNIINIDKHILYFIFCKVPQILLMNEKLDNDEWNLRDSFTKNELFKNNITYKSYSEIIDQYDSELIQKFDAISSMFDKVCEIIKDGCFMNLYEKEITLHEFYEHISSIIFPD